MGQSSSKRRHKSRRDVRILRVPSSSSSYGRTYAFRTDDKVLIVPARNNVHNKFYSAPRVRHHSDGSISRGVILYRTSESGVPVPVVQQQPRVRSTSLHQVFENKGQERRVFYASRSLTELQKAAKHSKHKPVSHVNYQRPVVVSNGYSTVSYPKTIKSSANGEVRKGLGTHHHGQRHTETRHQPDTNTTIRPLRTTEIYSQREPTTKSVQKPSRRPAPEAQRTVPKGTIRKTELPKKGKEHLKLEKNRHRKETHLQTQKRQIDKPKHKVTGDQAGKKRMENTINKVKSAFKEVTGSRKTQFMPSIKRKKDIIPDPKMFEAIDFHAIECPEALKASLNTLANYITKPAVDDLQRVRAIYVWVTHNISYENEVVFVDESGSDPNDAKTVLYSRMASSLGFANVFAALCREVEITAKVIPGFSKDFSHNPDKFFETSLDSNHAWNMVHLQEEWRLVDCTLGTGYMDDNGQFHVSFSEYFFLTDPDKFIWSHFPFLPDGLEASLPYQLLHAPLSLVLFNKKVSPTRAGLEWGLELITHKDNIVHVDKCVKIEFRVRKMRLLNLTCKLVDTVTGQSCDRYVVPRRKPSGSFSITVYPPEPSTYKIKIYGTPEEGENFLSTPVVSYLLRCLTAIPKLQPYPEHDGLWGVKPDARKYGFSDDVFKNDYFITDTGLLEFPVGMIQNVTTMLKLHHAVHDIPDLSDYVTSEYTFVGMKIKARFPKPGHYKLSIFAKQPGTEGNTVDLIAVYLIQSRAVAEDCQPFPKTFPFTQKCLCRLEMPQSGLLPADEWIKFVIRSDILQRVLVDGRGAPAASPGAFNGVIQPQSGGQVVSIYGNMDGGVDHDELYRFSVEETREPVMV